MTLRAAVVAILISIPYVTRAEFVPCQGDSFSFWDAELLSWLITVGLTEQTCYENSIGRVKADCIETINAKAKGSAAIEILTSSEFQYLPVKHLVAEIDGTYLDGSFACYSSWAFPTSAADCPDTIVDLWLSDSLLSLEKLNIKNTQIGGELPESLPQSISEIELGENLFKGKLPMTWAKAAKLEVFVVHERGLQKSDLLDDKNVWPEISELDVCLGSPGRSHQQGEDFIRKSPGDLEQMLCQDLHCPGSGCDSGWRSLQCGKWIGEKDAKLVARSSDYADQGMHVDYKWGLPQPPRSSACDYQRRNMSPETDECLNEASSLARIVGVETEWRPENQPSVEELFDSFGDLPCLQALQITGCPGRLPDLGTLHQLRNLTLLCPNSSRIAENMGLKFPPSLEKLTTQGIMFASGELSDTVLPRLKQLDIADSGLPQDVPVGLQHIRIKLDPTSEWVIPKRWAGLTELRSIAIEGVHPSDRLRLQLTPVFSNMTLLEDVEICLRTAIPDLTRVQLCSMDVAVHLCTTKGTLGCRPTDLAVVIAISWCILGVMFVVCLLHICCCPKKQAAESVYDQLRVEDSEFPEAFTPVCAHARGRDIITPVHMCLAVVYLGAVCSYVWLILETFPSIFAKVMLGFGVFHCVVSVLFFWRSIASTGKYAFSRSDARGSAPGLLDTAWYFWRFKGGAFSRCLKTALLVFAAPLVLEFASLMHVLTGGGKITCISSEVDFGAYLYWRTVVQGAAVSPLQAIFQSVVFNLPLAQFYSMLATLHVPVWMFALTLALAQLSILAAGFIILEARWGSRSQRDADNDVIII
ncbi:hypothetical protein BSKO_09247 [Bryopsis sp. KO-2023]|nr:hypothetical protein BSKO_09247 [Bryopsis sp. KO-2023]